MRQFYTYHDGVQLKNLFDGSPTVNLALDSAAHKQKINLLLVPSTAIAAGLSDGLYQTAQSSVHDPAIVSKHIAMLESAPSGYLMPSDDGTLLLSTRDFHLGPALGGLPFLNEAKSYPATSSSSLSPTPVKGDWGLALTGTAADSSLSNMLTKIRQYDTLVPFTLENFFRQDVSVVLTNTGSGVMMACLFKVGHGPKFILMGTSTGSYWYYTCTTGREPVNVPDLPGIFDGGNDHVTVPNATSTLAYEGALAEFANGLMKQALIARPALFDAMASFPFTHTGEFSRTGWDGTTINPTEPLGYNLYQIEDFKILGLPPGLTDVQFRFSFPTVSSVDPYSFLKAYSPSGSFSRMEATLVDMAGKYSGSAFTALTDAETGVGGEAVLEGRITDGFFYTSGAGIMVPRPVFSGLDLYKKYTAAASIAFKSDDFSKISFSGGLTFGQIDANVGSIQTMNSLCTPQIFGLGPEAGEVDADALLLEEILAGTPSLSFVFESVTQVWTGSVTYTDYLAATQTRDLDGNPLSFVDALTYVPSARITVTGATLDDLVATLTTYPTYAEFIAGHDASSFTPEKEARSWVLDSCLDTFNGAKLLNYSGADADKRAKILINLLGGGNNTPGAFVDLLIAHTLDDPIEV